MATKKAKGVDEIVAQLNEMTLSYEEWIKIGRMTDKRRLEAFVKKTSGCFDLANSIRSLSLDNRVAHRTAMIRLKETKPGWMTDAFLVKGKYYVPHKHWDSFNEWANEHLKRAA